IVSHGVLNVAVAEVGLHRPRLVSSVGQYVTASVPEHVWVHLEVKLGLNAGPRNSTLSFRTDETLFFNSLDSLAAPPVLHPRSGALGRWTAVSALAYEIHARVSDCDGGRCYDR